MNKHLFYERFWKSVWITYLVVFIIFGLTNLFLFWARDDTRELHRFQYDFFAALSGKQEEMKYGRVDALPIAQTLRSIPTERRNEDFSDMLALSLAGKDAQAIRDQLATRDFSKLERLSLYSSLLDTSSSTNNDWRDTFLNVNMRLAIIDVLNGGPAQVIGGTEGPLFFSWNTWLWPIFIAQFFAFFFYFLACVISDYDKYNPLFDLPPGAGSKLSLLATFPGSVPIVFIILLFSGQKRLKGVFARNREKKSTPKINFPTTGSTREALSQLQKRMNRGKW